VIYFYYVPPNNYYLLGERLTKVATIKGTEQPMHKKNKQSWIGFYQKGGKKQ